MKKLFKKPNIPKPSVDQVNSWLREWEKLPLGYVPQDKALSKLFLRTYPFNKDIDDVLIKVCVLNHFYSTGIRGSQIFVLASHIVNCDIDNDLVNKNLNLVEKIASGHGIHSEKKDKETGAIIKKGKEITYYSFATKYCANHQPEIYPIYDSYVEKMLLHFKDEFGDFLKQNIKDFKKYIDILIRFKNYYKLDSFSLRDIDKYLWQAGKKYFPKNYSKKVVKVD